MTKYKNRFKPSLGQSVMAYLFIYLFIYVFIILLERGQTFSNNDLIKLFQ
jgi:hypothetical protein